MKEPTTVGLSRAAHDQLTRLKEQGHFGSMADAYRFAIALALAEGAEPGPAAGERQTIFNVGTLDPDRTLHFAVQALMDCGDEPVYRMVERLAEWGVTELSRRAEERGRIYVEEMLAQAEAATG